jgi:hypothetical protein
LIVLPSSLIVRTSTYKPLWAKYPPRAFSKAQTVRHNEEETMPTRAFALPKQWEDWVGVVLGLWLCVSPWALQDGAPDMTVTQNAFLMGLLLIVVETVILFSFRPWEEWINVAIGGWLIISPWVLGVGAPFAMANFVIVGALVLALALYELWDVRHHAAHPA